MERPFLLVRMLGRRSKYRHRLMQAKTVWYRLRRKKRWRAGSQCAGCTEAAVHVGGSTSVRHAPQRPGIGNMQRLAPGRFERGRRDRLIVRLCTSVSKGGMRGDTGKLNQGNVIVDGVSLTLGISIKQRRRYCVRLKHRHWIMPRIGCMSHACFEHWRRGRCMTRQAVQRGHLALTRRAGFERGAIGQRAH